MEEDEVAGKNDAQCSSLVFVHFTGGHGFFDENFRHPEREGDPSDEHHEKDRGQQREVDGLDVESQERKVQVLEYHAVRST